MKFGIKDRLLRQIHKIKLAQTSIQIKANNERDALLLCHALEKGMGMPNPRKGFGQEKARQLLHVLKILMASGRNDTYAFQEGLSVLEAYCNFQRGEDIAFTEVSQEVHQLYADCHHLFRGGYVVVNRTKLDKGKELDFKSFTESRHSMRTYSQDPVTREEILSAIHLAKRCPSACNRQPWKFYYSFKQDKIDAIRQALPVQPFLDSIPFFGVVTVNKTLFAEIETNQWYINGGIFLGFLELAFHSLGIGSCIFQYTMFSKSERQLRIAIQIPDEDVIVAVMGYGKYPDNAKCIIADRREDDDIAILR